MITQSISGPIGSGVRQYVISQLPDISLDEIVVITAYEILAEQFRDILPGSDVMTFRQFKRSLIAPHTKLILVDEIHDFMFKSLVVELQQTSTPVWLINRDIPCMDFSSSK